MAVKRDNLVNERETLGLTQRELGEKLSIAEVTVRKLESGARNPSNKTAKKFALFFQKDLDYLFPDIFFIKFDTKRIKGKTNNS